MTLGEYTRQAAKAARFGKVIGSADIWDTMDPRRSLTKRKKLMIKVLREIASGLAFMHDHQKLHQSIGPESVILSNCNASFVSILDQSEYV